MGQSLGTSNHSIQTMAQSLMKNMCSHFLAPYITTTTREREREHRYTGVGETPNFSDKIKGGWTPSYHKQWQQWNNNAGKLRVKNLLSDRYSGKLYIKTWKKTVLKPAWADWCMMRITSESVWKSYRVTHTALTWSPYLWKNSIPRPQ